MEAPRGVMEAAEAACRRRGVIFLISKGAIRGVFGPREIKKLKGGSEAFLGAEISYNLFCGVRGQRT